MQTQPCLVPVCPFLRSLALRDGAVFREEYVGRLIECLLDVEVAGPEFALQRQIPIRRKCLRKLEDFPSSSFSCAVSRQAWLRTTRSWNRGGGKAEPSHPKFQYFPSSIVP